MRLVAGFRTPINVEFEISAERRLRLLERLLLLHCFSPMAFILSAHS